MNHSPCTVQVWGGGDKKEAVFLYTNMDKLSRQIIK